MTNAVQRARRTLYLYTTLLVVWLIVMCVYPWLIPGSLAIAALWIWLSITIGYNKH